MGRYITQRILYVLPTLILASVITFALGLYGPGDPLRDIMGQNYFDPILRERTRHALGLDRPFVEQYVDWLSGMVQGQFGYSLMSQQRSINLMIAAAWPKTVQLGLVAMLFWFVSGVSLGIVAALNHNKWIDYAIVASTVALSAFPPFVLGPMLLILFSLTFPIIKAPFGWEGLWSPKILMPAFVIAAVSIADLTRQMRSSILEVLGQDYIRTARSKGLNKRLIIGRHVLRNAFNPILTIVVTSVSWFMGGALFAELIFNIHGFGMLTYQGVVGLDYPVLVVTTMLVAIITMSMNVLVDILYGALDPRVSIQGESK
jgi:peptide/nickel transport system permease protein